MKNQTLIVCLLSLVLSCTLWSKENDPEKKTVIVGGLVVKPGVMDFKPNTTIYAMIIAAGGPTEIGSLKRVDLYRGDKVIRLDLTDKDTKNKELVQPNDAIAVRQVFTPGR